jgi:steroid delta-isomerase-like uncharacterized protein
MSEMQQSALNLVQRYTDAWNSHNGSAVAECFSDDAVYAEVTLGERFEGRDAIRQFVDDVSVSLSTDYRFTVGQVIITDDAYAFEWTMSGTNDCPDSRRGLPGTGKRFEFPGVAIGRMRKGRIVENKSYWNLATYLMQLGLTLEQVAPPQP